MTSKTFTAKGMSDLLGTVPTLFGFHPEDSLIAIATYGERNRFGFRLRLDIPDLHQVNDAAEQITHHLVGQNAEKVVLIALTDRKAEADALVRRTIELLGEIPVLVAVRADGTDYWSYFDNTRGFDNTGERGTPYADPAVAPIVVEAIGEGHPIYANRAELQARYNTATTQALEQVRDAIDGASGETGSAGSGEFGTVSERVLGELDTITADPTAITDQSIAWLAIGASLIPIRDAMWARMTRDNAQTHAEIWRHVANHIVAEAAVAPYTLCAFANWLQGDGAQALIALERAQSIEPGYSMAGLIETLLVNGLSPENWDGFDASTAI
ncbi:MAG: DUF4192 domain-containing protein [Actinomycetota bacterium]|nr:DUF4192 domain-containing protein [Actinomycetota bacterium]